VPVFAFVCVVAGSLALMLHGRRRGRVERRALAIRGLANAPAAPAAHTPLSVIRWLVSIDAADGSIPTAARGAVAAAIGALIGMRLAGALGALIGAGAAVGVLHAVRRSRVARLARTLERQLAEVVDACALAVRGGASVAQAVAVGAEEVEEPMRSLVHVAVSQQRLGLPFDDSLHGFADTIGTEDARLFALVMSIHHRGGGNVAAPLQEVATTIRHRISVRRELRALTAQARISGVVLGALPIGFFLVLLATSHRELAPVYRSPAGIAMIVGGLVLEALAFVWIRHLIKVEA
jgi:tight adherence protein B